MDRGDQSAQLAEKSASTIVWRGAGEAAEVLCAVGVLAEIAELAMSGYRRYPWGGVEIGGVLFGKKESETVHISHFRPAQCEHHHGPAFELSEKDCDAFQRLLEGAAQDEELAGLAPAGWYQTVSRRDLGLSEDARTLFHRFFPEPWQIAMIIGRSKQDPLSIGLNIRDSHGRVEMHSPAQEFTLDALQQRQSRSAVPAAPAQAPETAQFTAEQPQPPATAPYPAVDLPEVASTAPAAADPPDVESHGTQHGAHRHRIAGGYVHASRCTFSFFGLKADAFCTHPDAQFFYPSPQHREALAILFHRIRSNTGFLVLLGEPGTGKSIVLECLRDLLKAQATHFAVLLNSKISVAEFFELIAHDFRLPCASATKTATLIALNEYLLERSRAGQTTALVVDSAEKLSTEVLEEIELLGNLENRDGRLLQVVFAAQPSFERQLDAPRTPRLEAAPDARGRDWSRWMRLKPPLISTHRMAARRRGGIKASFRAEVLAEIHRRTHGVPRRSTHCAAVCSASCRELQSQDRRNGHAGAHHGRPHLGRPSPVVRPPRGSCTARTTVTSSASFGCPIVSRRKGAARRVPRSPAPHLSAVQS